MNDISADAIRAEIAELRARIATLEERHGLEPGHQSVLQSIRAFIGPPQTRPPNFAVED